MRKGLKSFTNMDNNIIIATDGACKGNPGLGGWGAIILDGDNKLCINGAEDCTTNNKMELTAAIKALQMVDNNKKIKIFTDSQYLKNGITDWIKKWKLNGWRTSSGSDVKNKELWLALVSLSEKYDIEWNWVKGHNGNPINEEADVLANKAIENFKKDMSND